MMRANGREQKEVDVYVSLGSSSRSTVSQFCLNDLEDCSGN